ncbi:hypothetical protein HNE_0233 [Hyphomonas neptunium ATCC 15444]|uniref:Lipoprotein n=2 Tax=Hyphomonas TaxID=85 RepID=Q0C5M9_HYPNA|nr:MULTISPECIES: carboxypeptidase-like regulatory domain-containing protein [Hyphomonas]ABI75405.1 hypothetical protein HNE_0233 [Hyphomonas neptunium ATCC 15444]KCZ95392.1 hypothetical protein HHI_04530 [Hyphomonas hirschiana VP5]
MPLFAMKSSAAMIACLCLSACITQREHVLAPDAWGIVIDARQGQPVQGAQVRYPEVGALAPVMTDTDGGFTLPGLTDKRTIVALPMGGVYRSLTEVRVSASGLADGYASAAFINGGRPAKTIYRVVVLMFPADAAETPLHELMRDCVDGPEQDHALHLADYVSALDPENPPVWFDEETPEALLEHLHNALPSSGFMACERMNEAYEMFKTQTEPLEAIRRAAYIASLPPHLRPLPEPAHK